MTQEERRMVRFHFGSQVECGYALQSFGIPLDNLPTTATGKPRTKHLNNFVKARTIIEAYEKEVRSLSSPRKQLPHPGIECPEVNDVLLGEKKLFNVRANLEFREVLNHTYQIREQSTTNKSTAGSADKKKPRERMPGFKAFIENVLETARSKHGFRFLKKDKTTCLWKEISDRMELHKKVSQMLRDERRRSRLEHKHDNKSNDASCAQSASILGLGNAKRAKISLEDCDFLPS